MSLVNPQTFYKPYKPKITIKDVTDITTTHTINTFSGSTPTLNVIEASCVPSMNHWGSFHIDFEDSTESVDLNTVDEGHQVIFETAKTEAALRRIFSGRILDLSYVGDKTDTAVWRISGAGYGYRFNERVVNFFREAKRLGVGSSVTADTSDTTMYSENLLYDLLTKTDVLPIGEPLETQLGTSEIQKGLVLDFIAELRDQLVEMSSIKQSIEDYSGSYIFVDPFKNVRIIYPNVSVTGSSHFNLIRADPRQRTTDLASNTAYFDGPYGWTRSISRENGYLNRAYAVVSKRDTLSS